MKYYVTADIHGFLSLFQEALEESGYYEDDSEKKIIICGDLFDRGEEAEKLQDYILSLMEKDEVILVKGNHEDCFCDLVTTDTGLPYGHHVHNGTYQTALDLTGYDTIMAGIQRFSFAEEGRHRITLRSFPPCWITMRRSITFSSTVGSPVTSTRTAGLRRFPTGETGAGK